MVKVFISHSMKDSQLVDVIQHYLKAYKIETYLAERDYKHHHPPVSNPILN